MKRILIIPALVCDTVSIVKLINNSRSAAFGGNGAAHPQNLMRVSHKMIRELLQDETSVIFKAVSEGQLLGCVLFRKQQNAIELSLLTVDPLFQKKGLEEIFVKAAEAYAFQQEADRIQIKIYPFQEELIMWYGLQGFYAGDNTIPMYHQHQVTNHRSRKMVLLEKCLK